MIGPVVACVASVAAVSLIGAALSRQDGGRDGFGRVDRTDPAAATERSGRPSGRSVVLVAGAAGAATGWLLAGVVGLLGGALAGAVAPIGLGRRQAARRARRLEEQLIDAAGAIASAVRSGRSLAQSLGVAAGEVDPPLGELLEQAASRASMGVPLEHVLEDLGRSVGGPDARLVTGVLLLHRRTGGALASSLEDLSRTLRSRRDGARELRSLTAQARLSAAILGLLPFGFFLFLSIVARSDVEAAYRSSAGASAIGLGLALQAAAFIWIRRLLRVERA